MIKKGGLPVGVVLRVVEETVSTNDDLKKEPDTAHGSALMALRQRGGRGRLGRRFESPEGGVYFSLLRHGQSHRRKAAHAGRHGKRNTH